MRKGLLLVCMAATMLASGAMAAKAKPPTKQPVAPPPQPVPTYRIPLERVGYKPQLVTRLMEGDSLRSLDFVDSKHLLLTFSLHGLMQRTAECNEDESAQTVQAVLLELPAGRVMARHNWHMCDRARYLWPLGHGRFMLRQGSRLGVIAPLENLQQSSTPQNPASQEAAFLPHEILHFDGPMLAIDLSSDARVLVVQYRVTAPAPAQEKLPGITTDGLGLTQTDDRTVSVNIYQVNSDAERLGEIRALRFGQTRVAGVLWLPMSHDGYLESVDADSGKLWTTTFVGLDDRRVELGNIQSTCQPVLSFLTDDVYLGVVCPEGSDTKALAAYSMHSGLLWMEHFGQPVAHFMHTQSPEARRFVVSVVSTLYKTSHYEPLNEDNVTGQWLRVYDTLTGAIFLTMQVSPVQMDGRNYSLAPDGRSLAVLATDAIEVYAMPDVAAPH